MMTVLSMAKGARRSLAFCESFAPRASIVRDDDDGERPGGLLRQFGGELQGIVGRGAPVVGEGHAFDLPEMFRGDQDRLSGAPDDGLGRGAEDRPAVDVEVFAPLGQEDPVAALPALLDDRLVDHPDDLLRFGMDPRRFALLAELLEDRVGLGVEAAFNGREELLIGGESDGAGDVREDGTLHEADVHDVQPGQLRVQFPGDVDAVGDGRFPVIGAIGGDEDVLDHAEPSFCSKNVARGAFPGAAGGKNRRSRFRLFDAGRDDADETKDILALVDHAVFLAGGKKEGVPFPEGGFLPLLVADGAFAGEDEDLVFPGVGVIRARQARLDVENAHDEILRPFIGTDDDPLFDPRHADPWPGNRGNGVFSWKTSRIESK